MQRAVAAVLLAVLACASAEHAGVALGWTEVRPVTNSDVAAATLVLKRDVQTDAALEQRFLATTTPGNPLHNEYVTAADLARMFPPKARAVTTVRRFLDDAKRQGISYALAGTGDMLRVSGPAPALASLLNVNLRVFAHPAHRTPIIRATDEALNLPSPLAPHVAAIGGLFTFPNLVRAPTPAVGAGNQITPATLKKLYNLGNAQFSNSTASSQALAEFQGQGYLPSDLAAFEKAFNLPMQPCRNVTPNGNQTAGVEASLDVQYIIATGTGVPTDFWLESGSSFDLLGWAAAVLEYPEATRPLVWSVSYGEGVNGGIGGRIAVDLVHQLDQQVQKAALLGVSVLIASGDSGVYDRIPIEVMKFHPSFPACMPSATAVGSTQLESDGSETTGVHWSGGGFTPSNYYTRSNATWQSAAVSAYLESGVKLPPAEWWDRNGRGIPDVSAVGVDYAVYVNGAPSGVSGTSASTPAVAGIISLLNDARLQAGKKPLGFLNPFLYANSGCFNDIQKGLNNGGGIHSLLPGFRATKGWDPVTGLGTPDYQKLKEAALKW
eukprot:m.28352 g.28352  ORF g.28352 m.28352 type:complete len:551 (-) comp4925_c0_seq2:422-2074(-)